MGKLDVTAASNEQTIQDMFLQNEISQFLEDNAQMVEFKEMPNEILEEIVSMQKELF